MPLRTRWLVGMMPVYVAGMTGIFASFSPDTPPAQIPPGLLVGLSVGALLLFVASMRFIDRWASARDAAARAGHDTGLGRNVFKRFPNLAGLLVVVVGSPSSAVLGVLFGLIAAGIVWYAANLATVTYFGGSSIWLQIPINILSYTVLFAVMAYINARYTDDTSG